MNLPCPSCKNPLLITSVGAELSTEATCDRCNASVGITVTTSLLSAGNGIALGASAPSSNHSVVVAIADDDLRSSYAHALGAAGWQVRQCKEGRDALQTMARDTPDVAVIDGGFAPIFGMGLGEIIKKSNVTRKVRLLGMRAESDKITPLPGAERTISITAGPKQVLAEVNRMLTLGVAQSTHTPTAGTPSETVSPSAQTGFVSRPQAPKASPMAPVAGQTDTVSDDPAHQAAQRLARIIVSDVVMYNQSLLDAAARSGTMAQAIKPLMSEGTEHYINRIPEAVRNGTRYLEEAIDQHVTKHEARLQAVTV